MFNYFNYLFNRYNNYLSVYPRLTNGLTGFILAITGDIICQNYEINYQTNQKNHISNNNINPYDYCLITNPYFSRHTYKNNENNELFDKKIDTSMDSKSDRKISSKLDKQIDSKIDRKLDRQIGGKINSIIDSTIDSKIENKLENKLEDILDRHINYNRSLQMGLIRAIVIVPFITVWYPFLQSLFPNHRLISVIKRVVFDQLVGSPIVILLVFLSNCLISTLLSNQSTSIYNYLMASLTDAFYVIKSNGLTTWIMGLHYWPFVHLITFGLIPLTHQPLFAHIASIYWNAILSYYSNKKIDR